MKTLASALLALAAYVAASDLDYQDAMLAQRARVTLAVVQP